MATGISDFENRLKTTTRDSNLLFENELGSTNTQLTQTLTDTMRTFKDQMSFNLQSLNLTLSTLSSSMNNLGSKISGLSPNIAGRYIESNVNPGTLLGPLSREYVNAQGSIFGDISPFLGNSAFIHRPYNVNPLEYYTGAQMQRDLYSPKFLSNLAAKALGAITPGNTIATIGLSGLWTGTHNYMNTGDMIRRMSGRFTSSPFSLNDSLGVAKELQKLSYDEIMRSTSIESRLGSSGYNDIAGLGLQLDLFRGKTPEQLLGQIKEAGKVVKLLTGVLAAKDVKDAMDALGQLKNMGVNLTRPGGQDFAREISTKSFGYGFINSMSSNQMLNTGLQIAQAGYGTNGIPAAIGLMPGMQNLALINEMRKRGLVSDTTISASGGVNTMAAGMLGAIGGFYTSPAGFAMLAAGMQDGKLNPNLTNGLLGGSNGLTNTIGAGLRNLFTGPGMFVNYARARVDMPNMLAEAGLENPYGLTDTFKLWNMNTMRYMPHFRNSSMYDKMWLLSDFLMRNQGMTSGAAKATAMDWLDPTIRRDVEYLSNMGILRGEADKAAVYGSLGAELNRLTIEPVERLANRATQGFVDFGQTLTDFAKRRETYRNPDEMLQTGYNLLYSNVDKNGKKTPGVLNYNPDKKLNKLLSANTINRFNSSLFPELEAQDIRAIDMYTDPTSIGGGIKRAAYGGLNWLAKLGSLGIAQYTNESERAVMRYGMTFSKAYDGMLQIIDNQSGWNLTELNAYYSAASNGKAKKLTLDKVRELGNEYRNNPFAYGLALGKEAGLEGVGDYTIDWGEIASDNDIDNEVTSYMNQNPVGGENLERYISGILSVIRNGEGLYNLNTKQKILKAIATNPRFNTSRRSKSEMEKLDPVLRMAATQKGYGVVAGGATNINGTADWQVKDLIRKGNGDISALFSDKGHDFWERSRRAGLTDELVKVVKLVTDYNAEAKKSGKKLITTTDISKETASGDSDYFKLLNSNNYDSKKILGITSDFNKVFNKLGKYDKFLTKWSEQSDEEALRGIQSVLASQTNGAYTLDDFRQTLSLLKGNEKIYKDMPSLLTAGLSLDILTQDNIDNYKTSLAEKDFSSWQKYREKARILTDKINKGRPSGQKFTTDLLLNPAKRARWEEENGKLSTEQVTDIKNLTTEMLNTGNSIVKQKLEEANTKQLQETVTGSFLKDAEKNPVAKAMKLVQGEYCLRTTSVKDETEVTPGDGLNALSEVRSGIDKAMEKDNNKLDFGLTLKDYMERHFTQVNTKLTYTRQIKG